MRADMRHELHEKEDSGAHHGGMLKKKNAPRTAVDVHDAAHDAR